MGHISLPGQSQLGKAGQYPVSGLYVASVIIDLDANGCFIAVVPPGAYDVAVFDDEHDSVASGLDLHPGQEVSNLVFELPTAQPERPTMAESFSED